MSVKNELNEYLAKLRADQAARRELAKNYDLKPKKTSLEGTRPKKKSKAKSNIKGKIKDYRMSYRSPFIKHSRATVHI